jgi:predicted acylesterase/phospholipase RssA
MAATAVIPVDRVEYLVFSGGGGKGFVHLGGVQAIEDLLGVSSLWKAKAMKGFAGASAGALLAMMLALGYSSRQALTKVHKYFGRMDGVPFSEKSGIVKKPIPRVVADGVLRISSGTYGEFETDQGEALSSLLRSRMVKYYVHSLVGNEGRLRKIEAEVLAEIHKNLYLRESLANDPRLDDLLYSGELGMDLINGSIERLTGFADAVSVDVAKLVFEKVRDLVAGTDLQFIARSRDVFERFVYNLLFGNGLLPGASLRESVRRIAAESPVGRRLGLAGVTNMTFKELGEKVEAQRGAPLDLVVSGTNLTKRTVHYLSRFHTPDFRVIDAVAISMSYPFLFKPVLVRFRDTKHPLHGDWADGGLLNNLPIHAFDRGPDQVLNHRVVAFRLKEEPRTGVATTGQGMLLGNFRGIFDTLLAQGSEGQIRTEVEELQTVVLDARGLSTLDLALDGFFKRLIVRDLIDRAATATTSYFAPRKTCHDVVRSWDGKDPDPPVQGRVFQELARSQMRGVYAHVSPRPLYVQPFTSRRGDTKHAQSIEVDVVATNGDNGEGEFVLYEVKASKAAPLTARQKRGIVCLAKYGGYLASSLDEEDGAAEIAHFPTRARVPPQPLRILRPGNLCAEFREAQNKGGKLSALSPQTTEWRGSDYPGKNERCPRGPQPPTASG